MTTEKTVSETTGPSTTMVGSGVAIFVLSHVPAVIVGAASDLDADRTLFVPLAGPWIDFAQRPAPVRVAGRFDNLVGKVVSQN